MAEYYYIGQTGGRIVCMGEIVSAYKLWSETWRKKGCLKGIDEKIILE